MLTKVVVRNPRGGLLTLQLDDDTVGYIVKDISGLEPVNSSIVSSEYAKRDGEQFNSAKREKRNIVFKFGLKPDMINTTIGDLRKALYPYFIPKVAVDLQFFDDDLIVNCSGRVESFETPLFSKEPEVAISVICFDPDFIEPTATSFDGITTSSTTETAVVYDGTSDTGFSLVLDVDRTLTDFSIYVKDPSGAVLQMDFTGSFVAGDTITVDTQFGEKGVTLTRSGVQSSILYTWSPQTPNWLTFSNGTNHIRVYATGAAMAYHVSYYNRYGGL